MRNSLLKYLPFIFLFIFSACEFENEMSDDELIEAIINSNEKVKILESDLPLDAKNTLIMISLMIFLMMVILLPSLVIKSI